METRSSRRGDLEAKRKRLEEIRLRKQKRKEMVGEGETRPTGIAPEAVPAVVPRAAHKEESDRTEEGVEGVQSFVDELLEAPVPGGSLLPAHAMDPQLRARVIQSHEEEKRQRWTIELVAASETITSELPEQYHQGVQVEEAELAPIERVGGETASPVSPQRELPSPERPRRGRHRSASLSSLEEMAAAAASQTRAEARSRAPSLSEEEKEALLSGESGASLLRTARLVERVLERNTHYDELADYTLVGDGDAEEATATSALSPTALFWQDASCRDRSATAIDWNPVHRELILAAYPRNPSSERDPLGGFSGLGGVGGLLLDSGHMEGLGARSGLVGSSGVGPSPLDRSRVGTEEGVVLVWNAEARKDPELIFRADDTVISAMFHPFSPRVIVGGTYNGRILVWDMRAKSRPVSQTSASSRGHSHPVYSLGFVGTGNAHSLVSTSTDGTVCVWGLEDLSAPRNRAALQYRREGATYNQDMAVSCSSISPGDASSLFLAGEDGGIFRAALGPEAPELESRWEAHLGPVTSLQHHPDGTSFPEVLLSSSMDWTMRLWSTAAEKPLAVVEGFDDYVSDCRWSPTHPSLVASADGSGQVALWGLASSTSEPLARSSRRELKEAAVPELPSADAPLTTLRWSSDGRHVASADASGVLTCYHVGGDLGAPALNDRRWLEDAVGNARLRVERDA